MKAFIKPMLALTCCVVTVPAVAQGVPTFGPHGPAQAIATVQAILENAELQDDPAAQKQIDQLRDMLAGDALTKAEADELFSKVINSKGTTNDD